MCSLWVELAIKEQVEDQKLAKLKIYGMMLESLQENALILIFLCAWRAVIMIYWLMWLEMKVTDTFSRLYFFTQGFTKI
jgi:hypothetical protein